MRLRVPRFFREDLLRKAVSLVFAILIWFAIRTQLLESITLHNVPVQVTDQTGRAVIEQGLEGVDVAIRGARKRLQRLKSTDVEIRATLPWIPRKYFSYDLRLSHDDVMLPVGVHVVRINPPVVPLRLDWIDKKARVPIRLQFEGNLPKGYKVIDYTISPPVAEVIGPSRALRDITELLTENIVLNERITQGFEDEIPLVKPPLAQTLDKVHVQINISRHSTHRPYHDLPLHVLSQPESSLRLKGAPPKISLGLYGPTVTLQALTESSIHPFIEIVGITNAGTFRRPVQVWIHGAANIATEYVHPESVEVELVAKERNASAKGTTDNRQETPGAK